MEFCPIITYFTENLSNTNMEIKDSKLVNLLKTFTSDEVEEMDKFVNSPFFNNSEQLKEFWKLLKKDYPEFNSLDKEKIFKHFYKGEEYKDKKIRDILSRMLELCQEFTAQTEFRKNKFINHYLLLKRFRETNLTVHYNSRKKELEKYFSRNNIIDDEFLYEKYLFSELDRNFKEIYELGEFEETNDKILNSEYDDFLNFSIYKILNYTLIFIIGNNITKKEVNYEFSEFVYNFLKKYPRDKYPLFGILTLILELQKNENEKFCEEDEKTYKEIISRLDNHKNTISRSVLINIYLYLVNYMRIKSLGTKNFFSDEFYRLLKFSYENDLYPRHGKYLQDSTYTFIATEALLRKDFEWAEDFIERFKTDLKPELRMNAYILCLANLNYRKSNYSAALKYLVRVSIDDFYYQLKVKNLQMKIHFEMGDYEMCRNVIDSFRHFLGHINEIPEFVKVRFMNLINFTARLTKIGLEETSKGLYEVAEEIKNFPANKLESKTWVVSQAELLKSRNYA